MTGEKDFSYKNIDTALFDLGMKGWELVTVSPRSGVLGGHHDWGGPLGIPVSDDFAGLTTQEVWIFKRPWINQ
jgi:hypothetical protein